MKQEIKIPFNKPHIVGKELHYISEAVAGGKISGDGIFTKKCSDFLEDRYSVKKILITHSGSAALDISALLCGIEPGDEVILPSYTFTSTANSFLIRGANLKFVDIREDNLNIDESKIEALITKKTKAIIIVHYAGVSCEMNTILEIAKKYKLLLIEDAAQALESKYKNNYLGTLGALGCYSFHETKNIMCGEGGALVINDDQFIERAEIIREKGTNRSKFFRGEVDKYSWIDIGSSFLPSDIISAFLFAQIEHIDLITKDRLNSWYYYYSNLEDLEKKGLIRRPLISTGNQFNGHIFYLILKSEEIRQKLIDYLLGYGIMAIFHYMPLHLSPVGKKIGYKEGDLPITENLAPRLLRLPLFYKITNDEKDKVIECINNFFKKL